MARLTSPFAIQTYLDEIPYGTDPIYRSPLEVLRDRRAHCLDGALLAAFALEQLGHAPLIADIRAVRDDDHVIAVYYSGTGRGRRVGAIAKSNTVGLRFREPIYRDLRELVMSYFEFYYNTDGEKTLRSFTRAIDLRRFDATGWRVRPDGIGPIIVKYLDRVTHKPALTPAQVRALHRVDDRLYKGGLYGTDPAGLYAGDRLKPGVP